MKRCPQCYKRRAARSFIGARGKPVNWCAVCRGTYRSWSTLSPEERAARRPIRRGLRRQGEIRVSFAPRSGNKKLGPIPVSTTSSETCPTSCAFFGQGCYAEFHVQAHHWRNVPRDGLRWYGFLARIFELPAGQLWRHNVAGDLPGEGDRLDVDRFVELVKANTGRRGFTFTHKPLKRRIERQVVKLANTIGGFTVNLSADSLDHADELAALGIGPVAVVLPSDAPETLRTPAGRLVFACPAETRGLTCDDCGLCYRTKRNIVGFRAHGQMAARVSELVQLRPKRVA